MKATIHPDFLVQNIAGEQILIGSGKQINFSKMLMLNETSAYLITRLQQQPATDEALARCLVEEYDVEPEEALQDVRELLLQLQQLGVVTLDPGENGATGV